MIDPKDLRIGNYVSCRFHMNDAVSPEFFWRPIIIESIRTHEITSFGQLIEHKFLNYEPITPEWLERLGFVCTWSASGDGTTYEKDRISLHGDHFPLHLNGYTIPWFGMPKINHIHQLQNLYFALTGNELTLNGELPQTKPFSTRPDTGNLYERMGIKPPKL